MTTTAKPRRTTAGRAPSAPKSAARDPQPGETIARGGLKTGKQPPAWRPVERTQFLIDTVGGVNRLARALGVSASQPSRWRSGDEVPSPEIASRLLDLDHVLALATQAWDRRIRARSVALIVDTGPLVAMLDATDPDHERCADLLQGSAEPRAVPVCVLVEVEYLLRPWPAAFRALLADFKTGALELVDLPPRWLLRAGELVDGYRDLPLGLVDANVIAASEMLNEAKIATLDRRHFTVVRPAHVDALTVLP